MMLKVFEHYEIAAVVSLDSVEVWSVQLFSLALAPLALSSSLDLRYVSLVSVIELLADE